MWSDNSNIHSILSILIKKYSENKSSTPMPSVVTVHEQKKANLVTMIIWSRSDNQESLSDPDRIMLRCTSDLKIWSRIIETSDQKVCNIGTIWLIPNPRDKFRVSLEQRPSRETKHHTKTHIFCKHCDFLEGSPARSAAKVQGKHYSEKISARTVVIQPEPW